MKLKDYLTQKSMTTSEFADKLLCHRGHVSAIIWGKMKPSKRMKAAIERETNGMVKGDEITEDCDYAEWKKKKQIANLNP